MTTSLNTSIISNCSCKRKQYSSVRNILEGCL